MPFPDNKIARHTSGGSWNKNTLRGGQSVGREPVTLAPSPNHRSSGASGRTSSYNSDGSIELTPAATPNVSRAGSQRLDCSQLSRGTAEPWVIPKGNRGVYIGAPPMPTSQESDRNSAAFSEFSNSAESENDYEYPDIFFLNKNPNVGFPNINRIYDTPPSYDKEPTRQSQEGPRQIATKPVVFGEQSSCKRASTRTAWRPQPQEESRPRLPLPPPRRKENEGLLCRFGKKMTDVGKKILDGFEILGGAYLGLLDEKNEVLIATSLKNDIKME